MHTKLSIVIIIFMFTFSKITFADVPIIVIAPSKKAQSISTVGSSVVVYDENDINNSSDFFLGDVLNFGSPSLNSYQSGGYGTISGIQLRGLPKRYSTVYIDGVKMSDPSSVSNDYYFDDILKSQISRVEILRGNQSSIYGSGAMGGTINITTKRGKPGLQKNISYNTGSNSTHNLAFSLSGADEKNDFYIGLERFETQGISAMTDNDENDGYRNGTLVANYGYKISDTLKFESNYRFADAFLEYDTEDSAFCTSCNDSNTSHTKDSNGNIGFVFKPNNKFTNQLKFANTYSKLIHPIMPHISEEIWKLFNNNGMVINQSWPKSQQIKTSHSDPIIKMAVQINGKTRSIIEVVESATQDKVEKTALKDNKIMKHLADKKFKKIIFVPKKIINIVI